MEKKTVKWVFLIFISLLVTPLIYGKVAIIVIDKDQIGLGTNSSYLYNDTKLIGFNETKLNQTISNIINSINISGNVSAVINQTELNITINQNINSSIYFYNQTLNSIYYYNQSLNLNQSLQYNQTINGIFEYNHTIESNTSMWLTYSSDFLSTFNFTYNTWAYNQTLNMNQSLQYNQTIEGIYDYNHTSISNSYTDTSSNNLQSNVTNYNSSITVLANYGYNMSINGLWAYNQTLNMNSSLQYNQTSNSIFYYNQTLAGSSLFLYQNGSNAQNINIFGNNLTANYLDSLNIQGTTGSGIISADSLTDRASLNVTYSGLTVNYPRFTVRLILTNGTTKYCNIPADSVTIPDATNSVYYIDGNCAVQHTDIGTYIATSISPGGITDFFNAMAHSGNIEQILGTSILQKVEIKLRQLTMRTDNMRVISGFNINFGTWTNFSIDPGQYQYVRDIVTTSYQNTSNLAQTVEWVYHTGVNTFGFTDGHGLNVTTCDNGTAIEACPNPATSYRRHFIFMIGYNDSTSGIDNTELHQLLPNSNIAYTTLANCLDTTTNPLTYTLPSEYQYANVMLYAYCARRNDNNWVTGNALDLRTVKSGSSSSSTGVDLSGLVPYTGASQSVNLGIGNNFTTGGLRVTSLANLTDDIYINNGTSIASNLYNYSSVDIPNINASATSWASYLNLTMWLNVLSGFVNLQSNISSYNTSTYNTFKDFNYNMSLNFNSSLQYNQTLPLSSMVYNHTTIANTFTTNTANNLQTNITNVNASAVHTSGTETIYGTKNIMGAWYFYNSTFLTSVQQNIVNGSLVITNLDNSPLFIVNTSNPTFEMYLNGDANITGTLYVGNRAINDTMSYNHTTIANASAGSYAKTYTDTASTNLQTNITNYNTTNYNWATATFMKISVFISNLAYVNQTNTFVEQQIMGKGLNVTGNASIQSAQNSTKIFIDENGNVNMYLGA